MFCLFIYVPPNLLYFHAAYFGLPFRAFFSLLECERRKKTVTRFQLLGPALRWPPRWSSTNVQTWLSYKFKTCAILSLNADPKLFFMRAFIRIPEHSSGLARIDMTAEGQQYRHRKQVVSHHSTSSELQDERIVTLLQNYQHQS
jgi:hypothetical protein